MGGKKEIYRDVWLFQLIISHIGFLFSAIISHSAVPTDFITCTILPIPKVKHVSTVASDNFCGTDLSMIYVKLFDNIVIRRYYEKLCTSELQFGTKCRSSTHVYHGTKRNCNILYSPE